MTDYRDKLAELIAFDVKAQELSRDAWCKLHGFAHSPICLLIKKRRHASPEYLERILNALGYELEYKQTAPLPNISTERKKMAKRVERMTHPKRPPGRPRKLTLDESQEVN